VKLDYQPISGWAIAGFVLGALIAVMVLGSFLFSIFAGEPLILPGWTMVIGFAGIVVCFIANREIQYSEGTRTGAGLASWGMWLSGATVLGFFAFTIATDQALYQQANAFLVEKETEQKTVPDSGFFPRLLESAKDPVEANRTFLLTLPTNSRGGNPQSEKDMNDRYNIGGKKGEPGRLSEFRSNWLVRLLLATAGNEADDNTVTFEPISRVSCKYDSSKRQYEVTRIYRITTPEVVLKASVQVNSDESPEPGVRRRWIVAMPQIQELDHQVTPLGENLKVFRVEVHKQVVKWAKTHTTRPIPLKDLTDYEKLFPEPFLREHVQTRLKESGPIDMTIMPIGQLTVSPWKIVDGKLQMAYPVRVPIAERVGPSITQMMLEGQVIVESATPLDPRVSGVDSPTWNVIAIKWVGYQGGRKLT